MLLLLRTSVWTKRALAPSLVQSGGAARACLLVHFGDHHRGAFPGEAAGDGLAYALPGTRDDGDFSVELAHATTSLVQDGLLAPWPRAPQASAGSGRSGYAVRAVAVAAGGHGRSRTRLGDALVAFTLLRKRF